MRRGFGARQLLPQLLERVWIGVITVNVAQFLSQLVEGLLIYSASMLHQAVAGSLTQLIERPSSLGYSDDWKLQSSLADHALQCREYLFVGQISCGAKEHQRVGIIRCGLRPRNFYTVIQLLCVRCDRRLNRSSCR